ncbi:MAG: biopolymer transporter ExbD [Pirellulales bacterium]|nr:biopolymer transporter ExbD [Pirellulales bacterium]
MRLPAPPRRLLLRFNMTPMIDVVFQLIIFFLVSSHLARQETQVELDLPKADTGQEPSEAVRPRVMIHVMADGRVLLGSRLVTEHELSRRLAVERRKLGDDLEVRIRGHREVPYRIVEPILLACARAAIWNVTFAVVKREE